MKISPPWTHLDTEMRPNPTAEGNREETLKPWGEAHPQVTFAIQTMAKIVHEQGALEEAVTWAERTLRLKRKTLGAEHLQVLDAQENLAVVLFQLKRYERAAAEAEAA